MKEVKIKREYRKFLLTFSIIVSCILLFTNILNSISDLLWFVNGVSLGILIVFELQPFFFDKSE